MATLVIAMLLLAVVLLLLVVIWLLLLLLIIGRRALLLRCLPGAFGADGSRAKRSLYLLLAMLGVRDATPLRPEILRTSLTSYRKSEELWLVEVNFGRQYDVLIVNLKKDVRQG